MFENVAFPLRVRPRRQRPGKREITERVERVLETMELLQYADRHATKLSGGQQQRLALARAIVIEPSLLLLDEPLSNLDAKLRESLRFELKRLQRELGITSIYVTHDQIEALSLSSNIAVMRAGEVVQLGKPRDIYENPQSKFVAEFIGTSNFIDGTVASRDGDRHVVETRDGRLTLDSAAHVPPGTEVVVSIRPEAVMLTTERPARRGERVGGQRHHPRVPRRRRRPRGGGRQARDPGPLPAAHLACAGNHRVHGDAARQAGPRSGRLIAGMRVAAVLRNRDFNLYWAGVVFSQIGTRGTVAANLYHVYQLTGSVTQTGLVGAGAGGGAAGAEPARRRLRRPLGPAQAAAGVAGGGDGGGRRACGADADRSHRGLAGAGVGRIDHGGGDVRPAGPPGADPGAGARATQLPQAFALLNPSREIAVLLGRRWPAS